MPGWPSWPLDLYNALFRADGAGATEDDPPGRAENTGRGAWGWDTASRWWSSLPRVPFTGPAPPPPPPPPTPPSWPPPRSIEDCRRLWRDHPRAAAAYAAAATAALAAVAALPRGLQRYNDVGDITNKVFNRRTTIVGVVTSVGDGDNFRLYHRPWAHRLLRLRVPIAARDLQNETLPVRLAGVDAPESAHFGMPAQPFSAESREFLKSLVLGRTVKVKLLARDRYNRAVATVYAPVFRFVSFPRRNVSLAMVKHGWAHVYEGDGAEYDGIKDKLLAAENAARKRRVNIWSQRGRDRVSPGEHKRIHLRGGT